MMFDFGWKCLMYKGLLVLQHVFWEAKKSLSVLHGDFWEQKRSA
jgi:hypothetical protein